MKGIALFLLLTLAGSAHATRTQLGGPVRIQVQEFVAAAKSSLLIELPCLNDEGLEKALAQSVSRGVKVRLLLSPRFKSSAASAKRLKKMGVSVRWCDSNARVLLADSCRMLLGSFSGLTVSLDDKVESLLIEDTCSQAETDLEKTFEAQWEKAEHFSMESLELGDQLKALPSPQDDKDKQPRVNVTRRIQ